MSRQISLQGPAKAESRGLGAGSPRAGSEARLECMEMVNAEGIGRGTNRVGYGASLAFVCVSSALFFNEQPTGDAPIQRVFT